MIAKTTGTCYAQSTTPELQPTGPAKENTMNTTARLTEIIGGCTLNAEAAHKIEAEFVLIPRTELPETRVSFVAGNIYTANAQENYQPAMVFYANNGDVPGEWNRKIAYANLAVAEAIDARNADLKVIAAAELAADNDKLDAEALALYNARHEEIGLTLDGQMLLEYRKIARAAREIHGVTK